MTFNLSSLASQTSRAIILNSTRLKSLSSLVIMPKCQNCGMKLWNTRVGLLIIDNPIGIQCIYCFSVHSWATGKLIREVKKDSKKN